MTTQPSHFNFLDGTYLVENFSRIAQGELPYRDFYLLLTPAHYLWNGFLIWATGECTALVTVSALIYSLTIPICYRVCQMIDRNSLRSLILTSVMAVGAAWLMV